MKVTDKSTVIAAVNDLMDNLVAWEGRLSEVYYLAAGNVNWEALYELKQAMEHMDRVFECLDEATGHGIEDVGQ